ncbi:MAG: exosortase J [Acidobacteriaceae bacterium]|jgi:exosortase J|nr:exosortase J [Acidobacteriaceae bacterium]
MPATPDADNFTAFLRQELSGYFAFKPVLALLVALAGTLAIFPTLDYLWAMWVYDPLKSLGMFIPLVSAALLLRAWRSIGWEIRGTGWGLAIILVTIAAVHLRSQAVLLLVLSASWSLYIPPHGVVIFAYASGVVLLFGGTRLYRAALFPILLLLCVDPVPHIFNVFVDLPLQRISAHVARGFAMALGQPLTPDQLRLMFTPDFGMFIAPGCNGIRGATTMGYIALVAGYIYRFRLRVWALVVAGAILLGYLFNFLRLCVLVLYYLVALKIVWMQDKATGGDYIIGACLFTFAAALLVLAIRKAGHTRGLTERASTENPDALALAAAQDEKAQSSYYPRLFALLGVVVLGSIAYAVPATTKIARAISGAEHRQPAAFTGQFPQQMGAYTLSRTWKEQLSTGVIIYEWAEYVRSDNGLRIQMGISPVLGAHDTTLCHVARGEDAIWQGTVTFPSAGHTDESFSASMYNDGVSQFVEASTQCTLAGCGEYTMVRSHFGIIFSLPRAGALLQQGETKPLPVLLRAETIDVAMSREAARTLLLGELRGFVNEIDLAELTNEYRGPATVDAAPAK